MPTTTRQLDSGSGFLETVGSTAYPFASGTKLSIGGVEIPANLVLSVQVYCVPGTALPAKLSAAQASDYVPSGESFDAPVVHRCVVTFADSGGDKIGTATLVLGGPAQNQLYFPGMGGMLSVPILDNGVLRGKLTYRKELAGLLYGAALNNGGTAAADSDSLVLDPRCHYPWLEGKVQRIAVNGAYTSNDVCMKAGSHVLTAYNYSTEELSYGVAGEYTSGAASDVNGIKYIALPKQDSSNDYAITASPLTTKIDTTDKAAYTLYWVGGMHVVIKNYVTSNVRVLTSASGITLKGAADG